MTMLDPRLRAWVRDATAAAIRGEDAPPRGPAVHSDAPALARPARPLPGWSDRELEAVVRGQIQASVPAVVAEWEERLRRVVGLHRRDPMAAACARAPGRTAAGRLLVWWSAVLAIAAWRGGDLPMLDALLTVIDALDRPLVWVRSRLVPAPDRELLKLSRAVAQLLVRRLEAAS